MKRVVFHCRRGLSRAVLLNACALALGMGLSACTSFVPPLEPVLPPVPARYPGAGGAAHTPAPGSMGSTAQPGLRADEIKWQDFFADARLKQLIGLALAGNRDLRVAVLAIEQARAQWQVRRADELPTVGAGVTGSRVPTSVGGISSTYSAGLSVSAWELDFFGRVRAASEGAQAQLLATEEGRKAVQTSLVAAVATAHVNLVADDELLRVTQAAVQSREASERLTRLKFDNGASSALDLSQATTLLQSAKVQLAQLTRQRAQERNAMALLLGTEMPAGLAPALPLSQQASLPSLQAGLPSDLMLRRPDLRQAEQHMRAANADIGAARAAYFPRITLTGSLGFASSDLGRLFDNTAWSFAPKLLVPIFDAGRVRAGVQGAVAARDIALAQYEKAIQAAFREVADALAAQEALARQMAAQNALLEAESQRVKLVTLRFNNGASSSLDVLDAERSLLAAQQAQVQLLAQQAQNHVSLYKALGGG